MPATLDSTGITIPTQAELKAEIDADLKANFAALLPAGAVLNTETGFLGRFSDLMAEKIRKVYELVLDVYSNGFADSAVGDAQANLAAMSGTIKGAGAPSQVVCTLQLDGPATYLAGTLVASVAGDPDARFENRDDVVAPAGSPATVTGTVWVAQSVGPTVADAGTLTETETVVTGWSDNATPITNPADAVLGESAESSEDLRARRLRELAGAGEGTEPAILAALSALLEASGVVNGQVILLANEGDSTDANGVPPHAFEAVVYDGTNLGDTPLVPDDDVAQAIWEHKSAGTGTAGNTDGTATKEDGGLVEVAFSRPAEVAVYLEIDLVKDPATYAGDAAVKTALALLGDEIQAAGDDVYASRYYAVGDPESEHFVDGVVRITDLTVAAVTPTGTSIIVPIGFRQIAELDTSRITVTSTDL